MHLETRTVANWGLFPSIRAEVATPEDGEEARRYVLAHDRLIARGAGKCYGDAALSRHILSTLALNRLRHFDPVGGVVDCEAGILLADLLKVIVPAGWFFHVTPGIKNITVGGAIASDVHGKNHPVKGCFSHWLLSFELMRGDGSVVRCSREENAGLFWQTCGGMGWTGLILSARFRLMPLRSGQMRQRSVRAEGLDDLFAAFEAPARHEYAAGWIDCVPGGRSFGRGVVYFADHAPPDGQSPALPEKKLRNVAFFAPSWLLNRYSIRLHNHMMFSRSATAEKLVDLDAYFYPLDRIRNWNRLYGRRGFIQYQFCLPEARSFDGIRGILEAIGRSSDTPFLTVLKRHGERPAEAVHSFPVRGYSLAMDFPRTPTVPALVRQLDELVWRHDGRIYLAKDACSAPLLGRVDPAAFGEERFHSLLKERHLQPAAFPLNAATA
jgi:decaprenylphospho-beta-D-ribofuranose 2-oxidase